MNAPTFSWTRAPAAPQCMELLLYVQYEPYIHQDQLAYPRLSRKPLPSPPETSITNAWLSWRRGRILSSFRTHHSCLAPVHGRAEAGRQDEAKLRHQLCVYFVLAISHHLALKIAAPPILAPRPLTSKFAAKCKLSKFGRVSRHVGNNAWGTMTVAGVTVCDKLRQTTFERRLRTLRIAAKNTQRRWASKLSIRSCPTGGHKEKRLIFLLAPRQNRPVTCLSGARTPGVR